MCIGFCSNKSLSGLGEKGGVILTMTACFRKIVHWEISILGKYVHVFCYSNDQQFLTLINLMYRLIALALYRNHMKFIC